MLAGACGFSSGAMNLAPCLCLSLLEAWRRADLQTALDAVRLIRPVEDLRARDGDALSVGVLKHGLRRLGLEFGEARPPLRAVASHEVAEVDFALDEILAAEAAVVSRNAARRGAA
jgi:4-hydroxy-tetrahydrodipicolinate synthase